MAASYAHLVQALSDLLGADNVRAHERVASYTTWRVGGPAALLCVIHDTCALARTVALVRDTSLPWLVLGRGSNVLVDDAGVDGGAIADVLRAVRVLPSSGPAHEIEASALSFAYRRSALRSEVVVPAGARPVVLDARFTLQRGDAGQITRCMAAQRARRKATQP